MFTDTSSNFASLVKSDGSLFTVYWDDRSIRAAFATVDRWEHDPDMNFSAQDAESMRVAMIRRMTDDLLPPLRKREEQEQHITGADRSLLSAV